MRKLVIFLALAFVVALALPALAGNTADGTLSGPHYNLNIIGVPKAKKADMNNSNRHSIFVALGSNDSVASSKIYLIQGPDFKVCDGSYAAPVYNCSGGTLKSTAGASFQLPCNTNIGTGDEDVIVPCTEGDSASYSVWIRELGKPGGSANMYTCATVEDDLVAPAPPGANGTIYCSTEVVELVRNTGKSYFRDVTNELTSIVYFLPDDGDPDSNPEKVRVALFQGDFVDWFWQYDNKGLKLAQLRFYLQ
jgi:hypothetical protein